MGRNITNKKKQINPEIPNSTIKLFSKLTHFQQQNIYIFNIQY
jgi:hypothetical protein